MSIQLVFSVFDSKAQAFLKPIFAPTRGVCVRMFIAAVNDAEHEFHKFSSDYTLFELAEFDEATGKFVSKATPESLLLAAAALEDK